MRADWLPDVLRGAGLRVVEHPGWRGRGRGLTAIEGVVWHHTASGPSWTDQRVVDLLIAGRTDLAGPLCQLGLRRDGTFDVIAAGRANHNGYGTWGNNSLGIEAYNDGVGERWPAVQVDAYDRGTAAILRHLGFGVDRMKGHRETDPRRKIDPAGIDMDAARARVAVLLNPPSEEDDMSPEDRALLAKIAEQTNENHLRLVELQEEVIGQRDAKGRSRMDRIADLVSKPKG